jgi:hypothetical protein
MMDSIAEAGARFATGEVIFAGRFATFTRTELSSVSNADHAFAETCDRELRELGFEFLGDLHSTQTFQAVFRGYVRRGTPVYGAIIENALGATNQDFYTRFPDGFSLTTALGVGAKPRFQTDGKHKAYRLELSGSMAERWDAHRAKLAELGKRHGTPAEGGDLAGFAYELDDFFCREHGLG